MKRIIKRINAEFTLFTWSCWSWSCHIHHQKCFPILQCSKQNIVFGGWTKIKYCTPLTGRLSPQCMSVKITTIWSCFQVKKSFYRRVVLLTARLFCNIIPQDKAKIYIWYDDRRSCTGVALQLDFRHWPKQMPFHRNVEIWCPTVLECGNTRPALRYCASNQCAPHMLLMVWWPIPNITGWNLYFRLLWGKCVHGLVCFHYCKMSFFPEKMSHNWFLGAII